MYQISILDWLRIIFWCKVGFAIVRITQRKNKKHFKLLIFQKQVISFYTRHFIFKFCLKTFVACMRIYISVSKACSLLWFVVYFRRDFFFLLANLLSLHFFMFLFSSFFKGEGSVEIQTDFWYRRRITRWKWRCRAVPSTRVMGKHLKEQTNDFLMMAVRIQTIMSLALPFQLHLSFLFITSAEERLEISSFDFFKNSSFVFFTFLFVFCHVRHLSFKCLNARDESFVFVWCFHVCIETLESRSA